jgi:hypothetical protein
MSVKNLESNQVDLPKLKVKNNIERFKDFFTYKPEIYKSHNEQLEKAELTQTQLNEINVKRLLKLKEKGLITQVQFEEQIKTINATNPSVSLQSGVLTIFKLYSIVNFVIILSIVVDGQITPDFGGLTNFPNRTTLSIFALFFFGIPILAVILILYTIKKLFFYKEKY